MIHSGDDVWVRGGMRGGERRGRLVCVCVTVAPRAAVYYRIWIQLYVKTTQVFLFVTWSYSMLYTTIHQHGRGSQLGGHNRNLFRPEQLSDLRLARHGVLVEIVDVRAVHDTRGIESGKDGFRRRGEARDILIGLVRTRPLNPCTMEPSGRRAWSKRHRTHHRRRGGAFR